MYDDDDELVPATALHVQLYGDQDSVWYDAVVTKVMPKLVEVFCPEDDATRRYNLAERLGGRELLGRRRMTPCARPGP